MNVLFLMKIYGIGGVEVATVTLADCFVRHGHKVAVATFNPPDEMMRMRTNQEISIYTIGKYEYSSANVQILRKILTDFKADIVINQWGLPYVPCMVLYKAKKGLPIKTIAVYHSQVDTNARIKNVEIALANTKNIFFKCLLNFKKLIVRKITSASMCYVYNHSDIYQVLSPSYIELFKTFTGIREPYKLMVQTNPVTIDASSYCYMQESKKKEVLYVGRIDYSVKKVFRVIDSWALLEKNFPDWQLTIVGDGPERKILETQVKDMNLKRVNFEGFQHPKSYYERASILILTSDYEGFPLVLAECMSFGVVPVVYDSYSAVHDIIEHSKNGIIIPPKEAKFDTNEMANGLAELMSDASRRRYMALAAIEKSKDYSVDKIFCQWMKTMDSLLE